LDAGELGNTEFVRLPAHKVKTVKYAYKALGMFRMQKVDESIADVCCA
jgi:hypothetical protein